MKIKRIVFEVKNSITGEPVSEEFYKNSENDWAWFASGHCARKYLLSIVKILNSLEKLKW